MRGLLALGAIIATPAYAEPVPNFEYKDIVAGQPADAKALRRCTDKPDGRCSAMTFGGTLAGNIVDTQFVDYYGGKLSALMLIIDRKAFVSVVDAFTAKYGKPCASRVDTWANAAGARLDNQVYEWCFQTGKLEARQYGSRLTQMRVVYQDDNQPPSPGPKIDF